MKKLLSLLVPFLAIGASAAVTSYSPPEGGVTKTAAASTDTFVSVTLARPAAWVGTVGSSTSTTITATGTPNWSTGGFASGQMYYVRMLSGVLQGQYFVISGNTADTLTVDNAGMDLTTLTSSDSMEVVPFWTLGTLYPASQAGTAFTVTTSTLSKRTQLLFFDATSVGINRSASSIFYFYNNAWRKVGQPVTTSFDDTIIYPDAYFLQRNSTTATTLVYTGRVQPGVLGTIIEASTVPNDNFVALSFPVDVQLGQTGLQNSGFTASTSTLALKDQLLWFDPNGTGINRSASYIYYYYNNAWRRKGDAVTVDHGSDIIKAGSGFIIRKPGNGNTAPWTFSTGI